MCTRACHEPAHPQVTYGERRSGDREQANGTQTAGWPEGDGHGERDRVGHGGGEHTPSRRNTSTKALRWEKTSAIQGTRKLAAVTEAKSRR